MRHDTGANMQLLYMVTGLAGTGKSFVLKEMEKDWTNRGMKCVKVAPTGCAAWLIGGSTLHKEFCVRITGDDTHTLAQNTAKVAQLRAVDVIVVDEFSMLTSTLLAKLDEICRRHEADSSKRHVPFAGKSVIMFGDPLQLPPVKSRMINGMKILKTFHWFILKEVVRQDDEALCGLSTMSA